MARHFSAQERLGDFLLNKDASEETVETLRNFLCNYEQPQRKRIVNAQLPRFYNRTSVHLAAERGLTPFLRILLKHGGNPNVESALPDLKQTPLHLAAKGGFWQCMELLLEHGANLNVEDMQRRTPQDHIRRRPKCNLVVTHYIAKFTIPQRNRSEEDLVQSLHAMMSNDGDKTVQFTETYGHLNHLHKDLATRWLDLGTNTLLYRACYYNCEGVVAFMLDSSKQMPLANLNRGDTPLHCACNKRNVSLVKMLLTHSPKLAVVTDSIMDKRYSPLHIVCMEKASKDIVELLLSKILLLLETDAEYSEDSPLDMNSRDANGCTALYYACYYGHDEIVELLLAFGRQCRNCRPFDVTITTLLGRTPLHAAVEKNYLSTLKAILVHCASLKDICAIEEIINLEKHPSVDTKRHLLGCLSPTNKGSESSSIKSRDSLQSILEADIVFSSIEEERGNDIQEQGFSLGSSNYPASSGRKATVPSIAIVPRSSRTITSAVSSSAIGSFPQHQRDRSSTELPSGSNSSVDDMSLFMTKDGSFLIHPRTHPPAGSKEFDELSITPLAEACSWGHSQAVDMLLSAGATDMKGLAVRLALLSRNRDLARNILCHHCKLMVEYSSSQKPHFTLLIDWSGMKIPELVSDWFGKRSLFFPSSGKDDDGNALSMDSQPSQFDVSRLTEVNLRQNNLSMLPVELLQLDNLEYLDVSDNHLANLPFRICSPKLKFLYLNANKLIELPVTLWYLPCLEALEVKANIVQSLMEDSIVSLKLSKSLKNVNISGNQLETLPAFLLELPALEVLDVSCNKLIGLPNNLWECSTLKELDASKNSLCELPSCEPQSNLMSSLQSHSIAAVAHGRRVVGARAQVEGNFDLHRSVTNMRKRPTARFVRALDTPKEVYSEEYIYQNENCCGVEKLNLSGNKLARFPDALPCLAPMLIELDMSHNSITEIDVSFLPPMMRKLVTSHNRIERFGTFVDAKLKDHMIRYCRMVSEQQQECHHRTHKEMKNLTTIDVSHNQLDHFQLLKSHRYDKSSFKMKQEKSLSLPCHGAALSQLDLLFPQLESINVSHNRLQGCFNHNIGCQLQLKSVDLSNNPELEELPMELAYFKKSAKFTKLHYHNLPKLRDPPAEYHEMKLRTLLSYMSSRLKKSEYYRYIKLIVVGCGERGKTTLLRRLRGLPFDNTGRTIGVDIEQWTYSCHRRQQPITFLTWDFAGQDIYSTTHQCFYSRRSLYLALYRLNDEGGVGELDPWLRNVKLRAPDSPVIVIGTHLDQVTDAIAKRSETLVMEQYSNSNLYPTIVAVYSISCIKKGYLFSSSVDHLRKSIFDVATHLKVAHDGFKLTYEEKMLPTDPEALFQQKIPQVYLQLQQEIRSAVVGMKVNDQPPVMRIDEFREKFLGIMDDEEELLDAVQYLHHQGTLLHFTDQALKNVLFLDPQWLCDVMSSVIRTRSVGEKSIVNNGLVNIDDLFTESKLLQAFKDECVNLLSKFDIALRLENHHLLVPSLLEEELPSDLPSCVTDKLKNASTSTQFYPPLWKFWLTKFIPNGFWPRLICRLTTNQNINRILKSVFPILLRRDCISEQSKDDIFLPWKLWRTGLALFYDEILLLEVKEVSRPVKDAAEFRVEACVNVPGWVTMVKQFGTQDHPDVVGRATSIMVEVVKHISSLATDWFPGMFIGYAIEGQVPCYVPCWKCCCHGDATANGHQPGLDQVISVEKDGLPVQCWEFDSIVVPAVKGKPLWCKLHCSINTQQLAPELFFRDLGDGSDYHNEQLWVDKEQELGKGGFGVVLKGELGNQDKIPVAIKVLLPEADRKLQQSTLKEVLQSASADHLIPQSYHDVRQEVSILSRLHHDNLAKLCGVRMTPIIPGATPMICLLLELAAKRSLRNVLKSYKAEKLLLEPATLKCSIYQIASGLDYLHQHQIAHLDIKSPNILVWKFPMQLGSRQQRVENATEVLVKIADYGTSRISTLQGIKASNITGTPGYMAPELFSHHGQEIAPDKVDVFAFGMTIYELVTMRPPYDELHRKDAANLNKAVRDGRRPMLTDKEAQSPVLVQDLMQMCWEHEPNNRPNMSQVVQWAESIEFDSLRVDSNLVEVTAISAACVGRIDPTFDCYLEPSSSDSNYELLSSQTVSPADSLSSSLIASIGSIRSSEIENSLIQPRHGGDGLGEVYRRIGATDVTHSLAQDAAHVNISACTQTWLCGRDKRKGLVTIFTYQDNQPGYSLFYGYACEQEIKAICSIHNYVWLGNVDGELRVIHAPTMKTIFVRSLPNKEQASCILDIIHVKADHKVIVSTHNCDVWIFFDIPGEGGLRLHSRLQFSDQYPVFYMTVAFINGSPEVWGTRSENKIMVFQCHDSKWEHSELQCAPFSNGRLLTGAFITSSVFTSSEGDTKCHVWLSFNRRSYIVCWDAVKKKELCAIDCRDDMQVEREGLQVSALLASGRFVYVGTTVGVIGVWSCENATFLQCFHYHESKVRTLLEMPVQVSTCVCPEVPPLAEMTDENVNSDDMSSDGHLITSIGNGRKKLLLRSNTNQRRATKLLQQRDEDICLLTWQCWK